MTPIRYVIDTSILIQAMITEPNSPHVEALLAGLIVPMSTMQVWIPDYCLLECSNVLWSHVKFKGLASSDAQAHQQRLLKLPLRIASLRVLLPRTLEIALMQAITTYDAGFIALAEKLACPLISGDAKQVSAASGLGIVLKPITDFIPAP